MIFRFFIVTGFLATIGVFIYYDLVFAGAGTKSIICMEFANATKGKQILAEWYNEGLLTIARCLTWLDFVFIFFYVAILITLSNRQVRKEPSIALNALLRGNFFFAVMAGLLDVAENILILYNSYQFNEGAYLSPWLLASLKFLFIGWTVLVWLISFVKSLLK
jgi:hypothetical protein